MDSAAGRYDSSLPSTRSEWAAARLRRAILTGDVAPGSRLVLANLASELDISPTPLREALQTLAAEGLVEIRPQRGARVTPVSRKDVEDLYRTRLGLEPPAIEKSVERADDKYMESIQQRFVPLVEAYRRDPTIAESPHRDFHLALVSNCGSRWTLRIIEMLLDNAARYRLLSTHTRGGAEAIITEHEEIMNACLAGNPRLARDLLTAHLTLTLTLTQEFADLKES